MGMKGIREIIYNSKIIKIKNNIFFCIYNNWTIIIFNSEERQEYKLSYNGIHITTEYTYNEPFEVKIFLTLEESVKGGI